MFAGPEVAIVNDKSSWVSQELSKSDRPELASAGKVISGGQCDLRFGMPYIVWELGKVVE